jgi:Fur family ferric uptake transcriptional regulator
MANDLVRAIQIRGLRVTPARVAVLRLIRASERPLSHREVIAALGPAGRDRATVYRALVHFERVGLVRKLDLGDRVWRFAVPPEHEGASPTTFECTSCGKLIALDGVIFRAPRGAPRTVRANEIQIMLRGLCDDCA